MRQDRIVRPKAVIAILNSVCPLATAACSTTSSAVATVPSMVSCPGVKPEVRPSWWDLACGDGSVAAQSVVWSSWTSTGAIGRGLVQAQNCVPDCASGTVDNFRATFVLNDRSGQRFLRLTVSFPGARPYEGASPWGDKTHTYWLVDSSRGRISQG